MEREKKKKKDRRYNLLAFSGSAALMALAVSLAISAVNAQTRKRKRRTLAGSNVRVNLSTPEILQLANSIISKSKAVHDAVGSVPLDKATFASGKVGGTTIPSGSVLHIPKVSVDFRGGTESKC